VGAAGAEFLEAPVSGSKKPAEDGALIFLTAGDRSLYDRAVPMLEVMGKAHFFLGDVGEGAKMKLVVNVRSFGSLIHPSEIRCYNSHSNNV
jgi:glyoxylate/succinic semialdehyde reductase